MIKQSDRMLRQLTALETMFDEAVAEKDSQRSAQLGRTIQAFHRDLEKMRVREGEYLSLDDLEAWRVAFLEKITTTIRKRVSEEIWFQVIDEVVASGETQVSQLDRPTVEEVITLVAKIHIRDEDALSIFLDDVMNRIDQHSTGRA